MVARAESYHIVSPGSPIPISFGMDKDPSQSMSLNPGAGSLNMGSNVTYGGGGPVQSAGSPGGGIPASWQPNSSLSVTNLAPVNVSAATLGGAPMFGNMYGNMGGGSVGGSMAPGGVHVKDLAPVHVTAQMPVQPSAMDSLWMRQNDLRADHPFAYSAAKTALGTAIPILPTVMAVANAYERYKHGQPLISGLGGLGSLGSSLSNLLGSAPGGPLSSNGADMYGNFFGGSGSGLNGSGTPGSYNSQLPNYPALAANLAIPASLPGGYWNQVAIHDAAPAYGPFSGPGQHNLPTAPSGISGV